jgi:hypothetical protein
MKKLFYRLSFTRLLSILAFVALGFWFSDAAHAQGWGSGPSETFFDFSGTLQCTAGPFAGTLTPSTTNATETIIVKCTSVDIGQGGTGTFQLFVSYVGIQSSCNNATSVRTYSAFCQAGTTVSGNLKWIGDTLSAPETLPPFCGGKNPCQLNIGGFPTKNNGTIDSSACSTVFPADAPFADKQVFLFQEFYHGPKCSGSVEPQNQFARYCHSDSFDPLAPAQCIVKVQNVVDITTGSEATDTGIVVSIDAQPNTVNPSCGGNKDNGILTLTIFGSAKFDVALIDQTSLTLNKAQDPLQQGTHASSCSTVAANTDAFPDLRCKFPTCQVLGPALVTTNGTVVLDGNLFPLSGQSEGTAIHGTDTVNLN